MIYNDIFAILFVNIIFLFKQRRPGPVGTLVR